MKERYIVAIFSQETNRRIIKATLCGLPFLWALLIFLLSHQPAEVSSGQSEVLVSQLQAIALGVDASVLTFVVRKGAHIVAYFILGMLVYNALRYVRMQWRYTTTAKLAAILCTLYAITDEIHQLFVPGRSGEVRDVLIDSCAALVGVWLLRYFVK